MSLYQVQKLLFHVSMRAISRKGIKVIKREEGK
jgi:hypothetical protein